jgi:isoleucyl-tRNA synthetase
MPDPDPLKAKWSRLREIRAIAMKEIEEKRTAGEIGSSLQAELDFSANAQDRALLSTLAEDLRFVVITSRAGLAADVLEASAPVICKVTASPHRKCERCWHYREDVGSNAGHPTICGRCVSNLFGDGEKRFHA